MHMQHNVPVKGSTTAGARIKLCMCTLACHQLYGMIITINLKGALRSTGLLSFPFPLFLPTNAFSLRFKLARWQDAGRHTAAPTDAAWYHASKVVLPPADMHFSSLLSNFATKHPPSAVLVQSPDA
jgi:hypothetical protein